MWNCPNAAPQIHYCCNCQQWTRTATRSCRTRKRAFHFYSLGVVRGSHAEARHVRALPYPRRCWRCCIGNLMTQIIIIYLSLGHSLKIRHGAIVGNIVANLYVKFNYDRRRNGKVLWSRKSDNNKNNNNKNNVRSALGLWGPVSWPKIHLLDNP